MGLNFGMGFSRALVALNLSDMTILGLPDGTAEITPNSATTFTLTISGSSETHYNGSKEFTVAAFDTAPQNFVGPAASGTEATGETLTVDLAGIWLYDEDYDVPVITYQWYKDDVAISGATSTSYVVQGGDAGSTITVKETATQIGGRVGTVTSADDFEIPAPSHDIDVDFTAYSDAQVLSDHADWTQFYYNSQGKIIVDGTADTVSITNPSNGGWERVTHATSVGTDQYANITLAELGTADEIEYAEVILCYTDTNNYYYLQARKQAGQDKIRVRRRLSGSETQLTEVDWNGELNFGLTKTGTTLDLLVNGSSVQTFTGESSLLGGAVGFGAYLSGGWTDNNKTTRFYAGSN